MDFICVVLVTWHPKGEMEQAIGWGHLEFDGGDDSVDGL